MSPFERGNLEKWGEDVCRHWLVMEGVVVWPHPSLHVGRKREWDHGCCKNSVFILWGFHVHIWTAWKVYMLTMSSASSLNSICIWMTLRRLQPRAMAAQMCVFYLLCCKWLALGLSLMSFYLHAVSKCVTERGFWCANHLRTPSHH